MYNKNVRFILRKVLDSGFEIYIVGGAVRDYLLGIDPHDFDFCTNARPEEIEAIFRNTIPTGKDYGTITVMVENIAYEITTYRYESDYDGRRPKVIKYSKKLETDLSRRDFTINSMAMDIDGNIIDYFNGKKDIEDKLIRTVGCAGERFKEDKLRMIRAIRFASILEFKIEEKTYSEINSEIENLSKERVREELNKILKSKKPSYGIELLYQKNMLGKIGLKKLEESKGIEQKNPNHKYDVYEHTMKVLDSIDNKIELRLAALLHDLGKVDTFSIDDLGIGHFYGHEKISYDIGKKFMENLKYSKKKVDCVLKLIKNHMIRYEVIGKTSAKKFINKIGKDSLGSIFSLYIADRIGGNSPYYFDDIYRLKFACEEILEKKEPLSLKDLEINGNDLIEMGIIEGKDIGLILESTLEYVIENPKENKKYILLEKIKRDVER